MLNIRKNQNCTKDLVLLGLFSAIVFILGMTPLGFIPIGVFKIVTVHIPVIIGSVVLGARKGAFLGFIFGLTSFIMSNIQPTIVSYFFTPVISGNILSLVVCFIPRILVGIFPYYIYKSLKKVCNINIALIISGILGSLTNTVFVMSFICMFFAKKYAEILNTTLDSLFVVILANVGVNAILEAISSAILTFSICKVLLRNR